MASQKDPANLCYQPMPATTCINWQGAGVLFIDQVIHQSAVHAGGPHLCDFTPKRHAQRAWWAKKTYCFGSGYPAPQLLPKP